ncbi:LysM peptidoglycan-binding domain-containing protein [Mycobacterium sp. NPDC003449]
MTILEIPADRRRSAVRATPQQARPRGRAPRSVHRPSPVRPGGAALQHRGTGILMSRASHHRRPITPVTTVLLALVAAGITVWLGLVAQFGGVMGPAESVPNELAVVQVHTGESLQEVARRVAPDAPVAQVVQQIRDLNELESSAVDAGQTLVAPIHRP